MKIVAWWQIEGANCMIARSSCIAAKRGSSCMVASIRRIAAKKIGSCMAASICLACPGRRKEH